MAAAPDNTPTLGPSEDGDGGHTVPAKAPARLSAAGDSNLGSYDTAWRQQGTQTD